MWNAISQLKQTKEATEHIQLAISINIAKIDLQKDAFEDKDGRIKYKDETGVHRFDKKEADYIQKKTSQELKKVLQTGSSMYLSGE